MNYATYPLTTDRAKSVIIALFHSVRDKDRTQIRIELMYW